MYGLAGQVLVVGLVAPLVVWAMVCDLRRRRLPNRVTASIAVLALLVHTLLGGWPGLGSSAAGLFIGLGILLPFWLLGMLGAGDVKFLAALGAYLGHHWILMAALTGMVLAGLWSIAVMMIRNREMAAGRWHMIAAKLFSWKLLSSDFASYKSLPGSPDTVPYGVFLGIAALGTSGLQLYAVLQGVS